MIYDKIANFNKYCGGDAWTKIFEFLFSLNIDSEEKRYDLQDGMFAMVMSYNTKSLSDAILESHQQYIDIQVTLRGAEGIDCYSSKDLNILTEYDNEKDATFYKSPKNPQVSIKNYPGYFTALWPEDAHSPQLRVDDIANVKKVVVKVPINLI